jgi:hypothetical protein
VSATERPSEGRLPSRGWGRSLLSTEFGFWGKVVVNVRSRDRETEVSLEALSGLMVRQRPEGGARYARSGTFAYWRWDCPRGQVFVVLKPVEFSRPSRLESARRGSVGRNYPDSLYLGECHWL